MSLLYFIPDDQTRSRVLDLAEERRIPAQQDGPWVVFEAVGDGEPVKQVLRDSGADVE